MAPKNDPGLGIEFEVLLPAYLCLKLLEDEEVEDFSIESNVKGFGNFDDLIIDIKTRGKEELFFALQLKHADKVDAKLLPSNFWSKPPKNSEKEGTNKRKDAFKLEKYCKTFTEFKEKQRKYCTILFTNRIFDAAKAKEVQNYTMEQNNNCKGKHYFDTSDGKPIYKFSLNDTSEISPNLTRNDFEKFLEKFSLYSSQSNSRDLENKITEKLLNNYCANKSSANDYIAFFRSWHKNEFTNKKLTKTTVQMQLIRILLSSCIEHQVLITKPNADCRKSEILKEVINSFDVIPIETYDFNKVDGKEDVDDSKILKSAKDLKIVKKDAKILRAEEYYDTLLYKGQAPAVIMWNETTKKLITAVLSKILRENSEVPMKMIICGKNIDLNVFSGFCVFNNLSDLHAKDKNLFFNVLNNFEVSLQGRENILIQQLIDEESSQFITAEDVFKSFNGELKIGTKSSVLIEHYVPRVLATICLSFEFIIQLTKDLLVINCEEIFEIIKEKLQQNTMKKVFNIEDFLHRIETASSSQKSMKDLESSIILSTSDPELEIFVKFKGNVHFLKALDEHNFQWITSRGDIQDLRRGNKYGIEETKEEDVCDIFKENNVNVICAEPGMGKSVLMENLKKYTPRDHWAVKIDFRECYQTLEVFHKNQDWEETFYKQVLEINESTRNRLKDLFLKQQKMYIFFDGLDELQSIHVETAITFIKTLVSRGFKIWISSRRNFQELLEATFNVFSLNIQEFSEDVQRKYIKNRLSSYYGLEKIQEITQKIFDSAKIFNNLKILGIPLQLSMLTEILIQNKDLGKEFNEKIFVVTEMFESFFKGKIKHYLLKETSKIWRFQEDYMIMIRSYFEIAGLKSCIDESFYKTLKITELEGYHNCIESDPSKLGIIKSINEDRVPVFQHNTYGEYFAACYFAENYETIDLSRLFEPKYNNIRLMFDIKLAQDSLPHLAVIYKDLDRLKGFENVNCEDKGGRTPLHLACCYGEKFPQLEVKYGVIIENSSDAIDKKNLRLSNEIIKFLRNTAINLFAKDKVFEWNSLQYSDFTMNLAAIDILLEDEVSDLVAFKNSLEKSLENYKSLMYYASKFNFKNLFKMLKKLIIDKDTIGILKWSQLREFLNVKTENDESLLHVAVKNRSLEMVEFLLNTLNALNTADIAALGVIFLMNEIGIDSKNNEGNTPLHVAAINGCLEIFQLLLARGADFNVVNYSRNTVLHLSVLNSWNNKILDSALKSLPISINVKNFNGQTPLHEAIWYGNLEAIKILLTHEEIDIESRDIEGNTPLLIAAKCSSLEAFHLLLEKGADINATNDSGKTVFHWLLATRKEEIVYLVRKLLSTSKLNVNVKNLEGTTILHEAISYENVKVVKLLLTHHEIDIEIRDEEGNTPLLVAARFSSLKALHLLLEKGADVNAINDSGETVLHLLVQHCNKEIFDFCKVLSMSKLNVNVKNFKGETILHEAIRYKNVEVVKFLLTHDEIDIESRGKQGNTPLHIAAMFSSLAIFHLLLKKGADVNATNDSGETVFHSLVKSRKEEKVDLVCKLLSTSKINMNVKNLKGKTILHEAIRYRNVEVVQFLLKHQEIDIESKDNKENTPLLIAATSPSLEPLHLLLEKGADVNAVNDSGETVLHLLVQYNHEESFDSVLGLLPRSNINVNVKSLDGETVLHKAIRYVGNVEVVKFLLTHDEIDIESRTKQGNTPLLIAAMSSTLEAFHLLLEKGADVKAVNDSGETVLHLLVQSNHEESFDSVLELLPRSNINVNVKSFDGETVLHKAIRYIGNVEVVKCLLTHDEIDIESRNKQGNTPLLIAAMSSSLKAFHLLLEKGADVNAVNDSGETVLHLLVQYNHEESFDSVFGLLPKSNIDVNVKSLDGETVLHKAIRYVGKVEVVKFLLTHDEIDIESRNKQGNTPLLIAAMSSSLEAFHLLLEKGADVNPVNDSGETVLHLLVKDRHRNMEKFDLVCKLLSTSKISVNVQNLKGKTILHEAIRNRNVEVVQFLLTHKEIDIESKDNEGNTPLVIAATSPNLEALHFLLEKGADVNAINDSGETVLHRLVTSRKEKIVDLVCKLLSTSKINVNVKNLERKTILHEVIRYENVKVAKLLLTHDEIDIESRDQEGNTPLLIAARLLSLKALNLLLEKGANVSAINDSGENVLHRLMRDHHRNKEIFDFCKVLSMSKLNVNVKNLKGETNLHEAIRYENIEVVKLLLTHDEIDIESRDKEGNTPLLIAAMFLSSEIFHLLLEKGADVNTTNDSGETVFHWLVKSRKEEKVNLVCQLLSTSKINVNVKNLKGKTILHESIRYRNVEVVQFLLTREEIDIDSKDNKKNTPLLIAAMSSSLKAFHLLLEKGAHVNAVNDSGETALHLLVQYNHEESFDSVLGLLPRSNINVNVKSLDGETVLHKAIRYVGNVEVVKFLLTHDEIDIESRNKQGNTPLLIAAMSSSLEAFHLLLERGADVNAVNDSGETVLHLLVQYNHEESFDSVLGLLPKSNINVNVKSLDGETVLHKAIRYVGNVEVVKFLLTHDEIDIEIRDKEGNTPLLIAAMSSSLEAFHLLLEKGADVNATNDSDETVDEILAIRKFLI